MTGEDLENFAEREFDECHLALVFPYVMPSANKIKKLQRSFRSFILFGEPISTYYWQMGLQKRRKILSEKLNDLALTKSAREYLASEFRNKSQ